MVVRFLHNYVVSGEIVCEEPLFAARIIREFSEIKEFREVVVLCEIALPYIP